MTTIRPEPSLRLAFLLILGGLLAFLLVLVPPVAEHVTDPAASFLWDRLLGVLL